MRESDDLAHAGSDHEEISPGEWALIQMLHC